MKSEEEIKRNISELKILLIDLENKSIILNSPILADGTYPVGSLKASIASVIQALEWTLEGQVQP